GIGGISPNLSTIGRPRQATGPSGMAGHGYARNLPDVQAMKSRHENETKAESLSDSVTHMLEECRMVFPGIRAVFGFQLVAVFNATFWTKLDRIEQVIHYLALGLAACSVSLVMTPASYQRQADPTRVSKRFLALSTRLLFWSMYPLM